MNYKNIIKENESNFNDSEVLLDFINSYTVSAIEIDITGLEDDISEYADGLVPVYYHDIAKEWIENDKCKELTKEVCGEYDSKGDIYKMMQSDLFYFYEQELREDYDKLLELLS